MNELLGKINKLFENFSLTSCNARYAQENLAPFYQGEEHPFLSIYLMTSFKDPRQWTQSPLIFKDLLDQL